MHGSTSCSKGAISAHHVVGVDGVDLARLRDLAHGSACQQRLHAWPCQQLLRPVQLGKAVQVLQLALLAARILAAYQALQAAVGVPIGCCRQRLGALDALHRRLGRLVVCELRAWRHVSLEKVKCREESGRVEACRNVDLVQPH